MRPAMKREMESLRFNVGIKSTTRSGLGFSMRRCCEACGGFSLQHASLHRYTLVAVGPAQFLDPREPFVSFIQSDIIT